MEIFLRWGSLIQSAAEGWFSFAKCCEPSTLEVIQKSLKAPLFLPLTQILVTLADDDGVNCKRTSGQSPRSRRRDCLVASVPLLLVGASHHTASAFQAPCGISARIRTSHCGDAPCSSTGTIRAGRVPRSNLKHRIRPRGQHQRTSSPQFSRLWAADQSDDFDNESNDESGISDDGEFGGDEESTSLSYSDDEAANNLGDCVSKGCSIDYIDAIAKLTAEQEMEAIAATSSSDVLVGDIFPVNDEHAEPKLAKTARHQNQNQ